MCDVLDRVENIGRDKGKTEAYKQMATDMLIDRELVPKIEKYSHLPFSAIETLAKSIGVPLVMT